MNNSAYKNRFYPIEINTESNFGEFYNAYYPRFVRYAFFYVNNMEVSQDMIHDALLYYWENRNSLSPDTDALGYILVSVKNKCLNYLKHLQVENDYSSRCLKLHQWEINTRIETLESQSYGEIFSKDIMKIVMDSLSTLPIQTQEIFILNRFKNKSRKEIASMLGVSQQKVDYHINKANDYLLVKLKDYMPFILFFFLE